MNHFSVVVVGLFGVNEDARRIVCEINSDE